MCEICLSLCRTAYTHAAHPLQIYLIYFHSLHFSSLLKSVLRFGVIYCLTLFWESKT